MKRVTQFILNTVFFSVVAVLAIFIGVVALSYKIHSEQQFSGTVNKVSVPISTSVAGTVQNVYVREGQQVKKNEVLVELANPALSSKVLELKQFPTNSSAQVEAKVGEEDLKKLTIVAPIDGVVNDVSVSVGASVTEQDKLLSLFPDDSTYLTVKVPVDEYQIIEAKKKLNVYSQRLGTSYVVQMDSVIPVEKEMKDPLTNQEKQAVQMRFVFINPQAAKNLFANEQVSLSLPESGTTMASLAEQMVNWWNQKFMLAGVWLSKIL